MVFSTQQKLIITQKIWQNKKAWLSTQSNIFISEKSSHYQLQKLS